MNCAYNSIHFHLNMIEQKIEDASLGPLVNHMELNQNTPQIKILPKDQNIQPIKQQPKITNSYSQFQTLLTIFQKQSQIQHALEQAQKLNIQQLCEQDTQNLFLEAIYFLQKQLFLEFGKTIQGLDYYRIDEITKMLSFKDIHQYPLIYQLHQRLFPILKFIYFQQPLTKFQLVLAEKSLHEAINGLYLHQQSTYHPELLYDPLFLQQKIQEQSSKVKVHKVKQKNLLKNQVKNQVKKQETKLKPQNRSYEADSQLTSFESKYNKSKSNINLYQKQVKIQQQEWTIQQQQTVAQLYCKVDQNNFSEISQRMIEEFNQKRKFSQNKIICRLRSLIRTGILILKQFCKKQSTYLQFVQLFINAQIAKQILHCRASLLTHEQKKVLIALNFHKNTNKTQLFNLVDKIIEFAKQKL